MNDQNSNNTILKIWSFQWLKFFLGMVITLICLIIAGSFGSVWINPLEIFWIITSQIPILDIDHANNPIFQDILFKVRFPRVILAMVAGAGLAVAGAAYQGLFKNPLADPYLIGVASGSSLAATIVFMTGIPFFIWGLSILPIASFIGGIITVSIAYLISKKSSQTHLTILILAGVAIGSFCTAISSMLMLHHDPDLRSLISWLMGSFINAQWNHTILIIIYALPSFGIIFIYSRIINTLQLDEDYASSLGVNVQKTKIILIVSATLITSSIVSFTGLIGFVGLIAPHTIRILFGNNYRNILPLSALLGGCFLVLSDLIARTIIMPSELPVGLITAFFGAPFFIYLLIQKKNIL